MAVSALLPLRHTKPSPERCAVCRIGLSNKQRVVVAHQDPAHPEGAYIHPVHKKCLLQGYRINRLSDCFICRAPLDLRTLYPPGQEREFTNVVRAEELSRAGIIARSLFFLVIPPAIEMGWAVNELRMSIQNNQINTQPADVESDFISPQSQIYYLLYMGIGTVASAILRDDIEAGRSIHRSLDTLGDWILSSAAVYVGLRAPSRIFVEPVVAVLLPYAAQFLPGERVRDATREVFHRLKTFALLFRGELISGAGLGIVARMLVSRYGSNESEQMQQAFISSMLVAQMLGLVILGGIERRNLSR